MTVVGKILVFFNLLFSFAVAAFAVMSYTASSNHARGYKELSDRYQVTAASAESYKQANDQLRDQQKTFREVFTKRGIKDVDVKAEEHGGTMARKVAAAIDARDTMIRELKDQLNNAKNAGTKNDGIVSAAQGTAESSTAASKRREQEVVDMRQAMG